MSDTRLVYSTETGRICPKCAKPADRCTCRKGALAPQAKACPNDGLVRIRRETQGRKGKTVTAILGLSLTGADLSAVARVLKQRCGTGGTVKEGIVVIQGDHRAMIQEELEKLGYRVKQAGG
ncbi:MAG: translation initiation factor Sui1 [Desulfobacteraceae bacterium]|nr:MAG: translation initiation factor Sui1 [Desulfobacteraceae bacterium]